jgi:DNA-binding winged helix-turn-helix (wHTH) protein
MDHIVHRILWFDPFALDLTRGCLRAGDRDIDVRPKAFEVLCYLAENAGRLVSKQELYEAVWPNVVVTDEWFSAFGNCARSSATTTTA